ncbi:MAG: 4-hydroxy-tetrahydrodipicolinate reductase, partial [Bacteroidota bacterium]
MTTPPLKIALLGYGAMGREVERVAAGKGHAIVLRADIDSPPLSAEDLRKADVAVHFAVPASVPGHVELAAAAGRPIVIGTTGWQKELDRIASIVRSSNIGLIHAPNFSLGVNLFFQLVQRAGMLINRFEEYDVFVEEIHHRNKIDSPSGTALALGSILTGELERKTSVLTRPPEGKIDPGNLHIASIRAGNVVGTHRVVFDSAADGIELTHVAKNRTGF